MREGRRGWKQGIKLTENRMRAFAVSFSLLFLFCFSHLHAFSSLIDC